MLNRSLLAIALLLVSALSAAGAELYPLPNDAVAAVARKLRAREYGAAREAARQAPAGAARDFLLGLAASRSGDPETAAEALGRAADSYPLLADYALYHQSLALQKLGRIALAQTQLQRLLKSYPDSPLARPALLMAADLLAEAKEFAAAGSAYQRFIEKYPSGNDSLAALYRAALCREQQGEPAAAVATFRTLWLANPGSDVAGRAEGDLQRLAGLGYPAPPATPDELYRRAVTLFDLKKYDQAIQAFRAIPADAPGAEFQARVLLKTGQAQFRARQYRDAEATLARLCAAPPAQSAPPAATLPAAAGTPALPGELSAECRFWLARSLDKNDRDDAAFTLFLQLAEENPPSEWADEALLQAALIRKGQKKNEETVALLERLVAEHPQSRQRATALWEIAWLRYRTRDLPAAASSLQQLATAGSARDKALYWFSRTQTLQQDGEGAEETAARIAAEFPLGYYSLIALQEEPADLPRVPASLTENLPVPDGLERIKALIAFGLGDEARKELAGAKKKLNGRQRLGIARLYLEMDDFNGALALVRDEGNRPGGKDAPLGWGLLYPRAYPELVRRAARANNVAEHLVYSVMRAESLYSPTALSSAGARGLLQMMPATAAQMARSGNGTNGKKGKFDPDQLYQPELNISLGVRHLKDMLDRYQGDPVLALAAYNAGSTNVNRWRSTYNGLPQDEFIESIPFAETREYVKKVLATVAIYDRLYPAAPVSAPSPAAPRP